MGDTTSPLEDQLQALQSLQQFMQYENKVLKIILKTRTNINIVAGNVECKDESFEAQQKDPSNRMNGETEKTRF